MNETTLIRLSSGKTKSIQTIEMGDEIVIVHPESYSTIPYTVTSIEERHGYRINGIAVGDLVLTPKGILPTYQLQIGDTLNRIPFTPTRTIPITVDPYCLGVCSYRNIDPETYCLLVVPEVLRNAYIPAAFVMISNKWSLSSRYFGTYFSSILQGTMNKDILHAPVEELILFTRGLFDVISTFDKTRNVHTIRTDDAQLLDDIDCICARLLYTYTVEQINIDCPDFGDTMSYWIIQVDPQVEPTLIVKTIETNEGRDIGHGALVCSATGVPIQYTQKTLHTK